MADRKIYRGYDIKSNFKGFTIWKDGKYIDKTEFENDAYTFIDKLVQEERKQARAR